MVGAALLVGACGSDEDPAAGRPTPSSAATSTSSSAPGTSAAADLAQGLLPAEAFGEGAAVTEVSREQLDQAGGLAPPAEDLAVTPEACAAAVEETQPALDEYEDVAAQTATVGAATTVEVLLRGGPTGDAVEELVDAAENCPEAQLRSPELGDARITFERVPVPDLGDESGALLYTTVVTQPGGAEISVPALVGLVEDGDRLVTLLTLTTDGTAPDPAAFAALLEQAYQTQADALG